MARTLLDLAKSCERRATRISRIGSDATKRKVIAAVTFLAYNTPVDTSEALSGWQVTLDNPATFPRKPFYHGVAGSTREASAQATILFAKAVLEQKRPGQSVWISNVQPHILVLDRGTHSKQPGGFVEGAKLVIRNTK